MVYAKAFFDLQLHFAHRVAELSGLPFAQALLKYTNLYVRFGLGRDFNPEHPIWQAYLAGLSDRNDQLDWTYRFYLTRTDAMAGPPVVAAFGCFSYELLGSDRIHIHFRNADTQAHSSLSAACQGQRRTDLTALFGHVQRTLPGQVQVQGVSWLYNIEAYRRLFPAAYLSSARAVHNRFHALPRWGQFLDRYGDIKESMTRPFLSRLEQQTGIERLHECFPYQPLAVEAPVSEFYEFYGISPPCDDIAMQAAASPSEPGGL
jgi:hypothetical protein